jgi:hypothetical protein
MNLWDFKKNLIEKKKRIQLRGSGVVQGVLSLDWLSHEDHFGNSNILSAVCFCFFLAQIYDQQVDCGVAVYWFFF